MIKSVVQTSEQFLEDFVKQAEKATTRIYLQSMIFEHGRMLKTLESVLIKKAREGLDVRITVDWVYKRYVEDNVLLLPQLNKTERKFGIQVHQETKKTMERWQEAGIIFTVTNTPTPAASLLPILGRNHTKIYLVDDSYAWIGGINLFDTALVMIDFMVRMSEPTIITALEKHYFKVNDNRPKDDSHVHCSEYDLFFDAGKKKKSIIYAQAMQLIQQAKNKITFMSQFLPDGKLLYELRTASKRGVVISIITSNEQNKSFTQFPYNIPYHILKSRLNNFPNTTLIHREKRVHAKLLIVDGEKALFGSHNFTSIGVMLGTEEIAIQTSDQNLVADLQHFSRIP